MGVYCFRWKRGPWLKVGHYARTNPWCRHAHRGWRSTIIPDPVIEFAAPDDFELVYWCPNLTRKHERLVHNSFPDRIGEWIGADKCNEVIAILASLGPDQSTQCSLGDALATHRRL